jgi:hypothetical protein
MTLRKSVSRRIHNECSWNRGTLAVSQLAGCFSCLEIYPATLVTDWGGEIARDTGDLVWVSALCPICQVDSVLPSATVPLTKRLLYRMSRVWFKFDHVHEHRTHAGRVRHSRRRSSRKRARKRRR